MVKVKVGNVVLAEKPETIASRIIVEEKKDKNVEITFVSPDGLAGGSKTYSSDDIENMRADIEQFL